MCAPQVCNQYYLSKRRISRRKLCGGEFRNCVTLRNPQIAILIEGQRRWETNCQNRTRRLSAYRDTRGRLDRAGPSQIRRREHLNSAGAGLWLIVSPVVDPDIVCCVEDYIFRVMENGRLQDKPGRLRPTRGQLLGSELVNAVRLVIGFVCHP